MYSRLLFNIVKVKDGTFFDFSLSICLCLNSKVLSSNFCLSVLKNFRMDNLFSPFRIKFDSPHFSQAFPSIGNL